MLSFNKEVSSLVLFVRRPKFNSKSAKIPLLLAFSKLEYVLLRLSYCLQNTDLNEFQGSGQRSSLSLIIPHAVHQIKSFTLLNLCSVYSLNVQGCMHWQSVSSDQSAECTGIQQQHRMLGSPCRVEQTVSAAAPRENSLLSNTSSWKLLRCLSYRSRMGARTVTIIRLNGCHVFCAVCLRQDLQRQFVKKSPGFIHGLLYSVRFFDATQQAVIAVMFLNSHVPRIT